MATTRPAPTPLLQDGPFDGETSLPEGARVDERSLELTIPTAGGVAIYQRTGETSPAWRYARTEPIYRP
jgi:hypothetical protein